MQFQMVTTALELSEPMAEAASRRRRRRRAGMFESAAALNSHAATAECAACGAARTLTEGGTHHGAKGPKLPKQRGSERASD